MSGRDPKVCLSVDFDAVSLWLMFGATGARSISRGEFGADVGAPRLLELCSRYGIRSTWYVPGHTADTYPDVVGEVARAGHEIGNHGYVHDDFGTLDADGARRVIRKANDALERVTGSRPRGIRITGFDFDQALLEVCAEEGFTYDSSLFGEYFPYWARGRQTFGEDGEFDRGRRLDLVEVPVTFMTSDFIYFELGITPPLPAKLANPRDVEVVWRDQFDYMADRLDGAYFMIMCHPQSIGWGSRILMLERFVEYCLERGARFVTAEEIADEFRAREEPAAA
jgi:peptidoglycan/xylan/chitin deacetylase (PgdA/CDA1 family)